MRVRHTLPEARWPSAEEAAASRLYSPVRVGPLLLPHRTWVPAMVPWRASEDGFVTQEVLDWYGRFARGRPAVLVVEATGIRDVPSGPLLRIGDDRFIEGLSRLVETVKRQSGGETRVFIQCIDFLTIRRRPEPERFFSRFLQIEPRHREALARRLDRPELLGAPEEALRELLAQGAPTLHEAVLSERELESLRMGYRERVTDLELPHIRALPEVLPGLFAAAARRAERAGFDGVELHYAHAYTMASFLSRRNDRDDGYGRTLEGRVRLPLEVFRAVRAAVSEGFVVGCRFLGDEVIAGGSDLEDAAAFARAFAAAGFQFLSVSKGGKFEDAKPPKVGRAAYPYTGPSGHECMPTIYASSPGPFGRNLPLSRALRSAVRAAGHEIPVVGAGGIQTFELAEAALLRGDCDLVASARGSLADPDWFLKARLGLGHEVRRCQFTNYCEGLDQQHQAVTCRLWDRRQEADPVAPRTADGRRLLLAPEWSPPDPESP